MRVVSESLALQALCKAQEQLPAQQQATRDATAVASIVKQEAELLAEKRHRLNTAGEALQKGAAPDEPDDETLRQGLQATAPSTTAAPATPRTLRPAAAPAQMDAAIAVDHNSMNGDGSESDDPLVDPVEKLKTSTSSCARKFVSRRT